VVACGATMIKHLKDNSDFQKKVSSDLGYSSVSVTGFNAYQEDDHYYLSLVGNAKGNVETDDNCEYFMCEYETDQNRYNSLMETIKGESIYDGDLVRSAHVIDNLLDIVTNGKLINKKERMDITYSNEGEKGTRILDVTKAKIEGNIAYYYIVSTQEGINENGEEGYYTVIDKVCFNVTKEIEKDPSVIFTKGRDDAYIETVGRKFNVYNSDGYTIEHNTNSSTISVQQEDNITSSR
jgi:hypothetical protein